MCGSARSSEGKSKQPPDEWWAAKAKRILHPVQHRIIEVLWGAAMPLDAVELAVMVGHKSIDEHLDRLLAIHAIAYAGDAVPPRDQMGPTFQLVA
jgi:hypothetical protein